MDERKIKAYWGLLGECPTENHINPYYLTRDDKSVDVATMLYPIIREYKTIDQISIETQFSEEVIEKKFTELMKCNLLKYCNNQYIVNFPFLDIELRDETNQLGQELTDRIIPILLQEIPNIKTAFENTSACIKQGFSWEQVSLTSIGGILLDTGINDRGLRVRGIFDPDRNDCPVRPGNYKYWYTAIQNGWSNYWSYWGHCLEFNSDKTAWFSMFYGGSKKQKSEISKLWKVFDCKDTLEVLFYLIRNKTISERYIKKECSLIPEKANTIINQLTQNQIVWKNKKNLIPNFPIFNEEDISIFFSKIDNISNFIINEVYIPFIPEIKSRWNKIVPPNWEIEKIDKWFIRAVFNRPYNLTLDSLVTKNLLLPPPTEPPFNYWGIDGFFEAV